MRERNCATTAQHMHKEEVVPKTGHTRGGRGQSRGPARAPCVWPTRVSHTSEGAHSTRGTTLGCLGTRWVGPAPGASSSTLRPLTLALALGPYACTSGGPGGRGGPKPGPGAKPMGKPRRTVFRTSPAIGAACRGGES